LANLAVCSGVSTARIYPRGLADFCARPDDLLWRFLFLFEINRGFLRILDDRVDLGLLIVSQVQRLELFLKRVNASWGLAAVGAVGPARWYRAADDRDRVPTASAIKVRRVFSDVFMNDR